MPTISAPYAVGSTVFPTISAPYSVSGAPRRDGRDGLGRPIPIGSDPRLRGHGNPSQHVCRPGCNHYRPGHYYHGYRPLCFPRDRYPYYGYGYYPAFGFGYAYPTVYLTEPYVVSSGYSPEYVDSGYTSSEYAPTDQYTAPPTQAVPPPESATGQPVEGGADSYQTLDPLDQQRSIVGDANNAFAAGRYEEARGLYIRAVLTDERDGYAKMLYTWANFALGDFDTAGASLRRSLLTTADLIDYPLDLRSLYSDQGALTLQTERLVRFVAENPDHRDSELVLAYLFYSTGEADRALGMFGRLAVQDADDALAAQLRDAALRNARNVSPAPNAP